MKKKFNNKKFTINSLHMSLVNTSRNYRNLIVIIFIMDTLTYADTPSMWVKIN